MGNFHWAVLFRSHSGLILARWIFCLEQVHQCSSWGHFGSGCISAPNRMRDVGFCLVGQYGSSQCELFFCNINVQSKIGTGILFLEGIWGLAAPVPSSWRVAQLQKNEFGWAAQLGRYCSGLFFCNIYYFAWNGYCNVVREDNLWLAASFSTSYTCVMNLGWLA